MNTYIRQAVPSDFDNLKILLQQLTYVGNPLKNTINDTIYNNIYLLCINNPQTSQNNTQNNTQTPQKEKIIGTITVLIEPKIIHEGSCVGHIEDLVVDKEYRKQNFGKLLINHAINLCKEKNCYKIILDCNENYTKYYEKNGFKPQGICMRYDF